MRDPAADPRPQRTPKVLGGVAALACVACCALPALITAGVVGAGAGVIVRWLPAAAMVLAVLAAVIWWLGQRTRSCSCSCAPKTTVRGGCGCQVPEETSKVTGTEDRYRSGSPR